MLFNTVFQLSSSQYVIHMIKPRNTDSTWFEGTIQNIALPCDQYQLQQAFLLETESVSQQVKVSISHSQPTRPFSKNEKTAIQLHPIIIVMRCSKPIGAIFIFPISKSTEAITKEIKKII